MQFERASCLILRQKSGKVFAKHINEKQKGGVMVRKLFTLVVAMQFLTACSNNSGLASTPYIYPIGPYGPVSTNLTLSTNNPLEYSLSNITSPTTGTALNLARPTGGTAMGSCLATYNSAALPVVDNTLPVAPFSTGNLAISYDLTQDQNVFFSVSYLPGSLSYCTGAGLLSSVACNLVGFTASLATMLSSGGGDLWIVGSDGYGSNALIAKKWNNTLAANVNGNATSDASHVVGVYNGKLMFSVNTAGATKLYRSNGSTVEQITQFNAAGTDDMIGLRGIEFQGDFYFVASTGASSFTTLFRLKPNNTVERVSTDSLAVTDFAIYNSNLYMSGLVGNPALGNRKLIRYDGSSLCQVSSIIGAGSDDVARLLQNNGLLYFTAQSGLEQAVMSYDGTTIQRVTNTYPAGDDGITRFVSLGTSLFLSARNNAGFTKLFEITTSQVIQTSNMAGSSANDNPVPMSDNQNLYFTANNGSNIKLYTIQSGEIVQKSNINTGDDIFTPIQHNHMESGELFAQFTNSSGQGVLTKISQTSLAGYTNSSWYQTLSGYSSGVFTVTSIARTGTTYMYQGTVTNAAPPGTYTKIYHMKH